MNSPRCRGAGRLGGIPAIVGLMLLSLLPVVPAATPAATPAEEPALIAPLAEQSLLLGAASAGQRLVAVGERGHILLSDDDGAHWRQVPAPTRTTLTAVHFATPLLGWAVGHDAVILLSDDGGESWHPVYADPDLQSPLLDLYFSDPLQGIAIGAYGLLLRTSDGGRNWQPGAISADDDFHLNAIAASPKGQRYIAAEAGNVYRSTGTKPGWSTLSPPYAGSFFGVILPTAGTVLVFGLRGHLLRSTDDGQSWAPLPGGGDAALTAATTLTNGRLVIVGHAGTVLWSDDGGSSFERRQLPGRPALSAVLATPGGRLLGFGEHGVHPIELPERQP